MLHAKSAKAPDINTTTEINGTSELLDDARLLQVSHYLLLGFCVAISLSIALSQVLVVSLILYWIAVRIKNFKHKNNSLNLLGDFPLFFAVPLATWLATSFVACIVGLSFTQALPELLKTTFYLLYPFCLYDILASPQISSEEAVRRIKSYFHAFFIGMSLAALHSVLSSAAGYLLPPKIPGPVTQSGQMVLLIPLLVAMLLIYVTEARVSLTANTRLIERFCVAMSIILFFSFLSLAWPQILSSNNVRLVRLVVGTGLIVILASGLVWTLILRKNGLSYQKQFETSLQLVFLSLTTAIIFAAFILNLKRGPWMGATIALSILGVLISRRILYSTAVALVFLVLIPPVRERIVDLSDHFVIHGGRMSMWLLGLELVGRFPLGLGTDNAAFMRELDPTLPLLHRHMHNNFLNIAVETGWIGLAAFIWWMLVSIGIGFRLWISLQNTSANKESTIPPHQKEIAVLALALSCSLIGWQVSGLVEYNFGDGEIRLIAFMLMGLLLALSRHFSPLEKPEKRSATPVPIGKLSRSRLH